MHKYLDFLSFSFPPFFLFFFFVKNDLLDRHWTMISRQSLFLTRTDSEVEIEIDTNEWPISFVRRNGSFVLRQRKIIRVEFQLLNIAVVESQKPLPSYRRNSP